MRRISNKSKAALAALGMLGLSACGQTDSLKNAEADYKAGKTGINHQDSSALQLDLSEDAKIARVTRCLMDDSMLALSKEGVFVNHAFVNALGLDNESAWAQVVLPNGGIDSIQLDYVGEAGRYMRKDIKARFEDALTYVCLPFMAGKIDAKEASSRIGPDHLNVGADVPKYPMMRPIDPVTIPKFSKAKNG